MLADDILSCAARGFTPSADGDLRSFAATLKSAQRLTFEADTCAAIDSVTLGETAALVAALRHSRIPFSPLWTEIDFENLSDPLGRDLSGPRFPRRVGVLFEGRNDDGTQFDCTVAASFGRKGSRTVQLDPCGADVDLKRAMVDAALFLRAPDNIRNDPAAIEFNKLINSKLSPYMVPWHDAASPEERKRYLKSRSGLFILRAMMAGLALLNSRNLVEIREHDLSDMNRRRKRSGKRELLSYSEVRINLSKCDKSAAKILNLSPAEIRQHIVRGHFKVRKGGVYWWRPFLRGSADVGRVIRTGYVIEGASLHAGGAA